MDHCYKYKFLNIVFFFLLWLKYGISPKRLQENVALSSFFKILTTSPDENGKVQKVMFILSSTVTHLS